MMTRTAGKPPQKPLLPREVGDLFGVGPKTVTRWVKAGKLGSTRTLGGHHRFHPQEVRRLLILSYTGDTSLQDRLDELDRLIAARANGS